MLVAASHLCYRYKEEGAHQSALDDISFTIGSGERVSLVGASGSGKSTLLLILAGLLAPDRGCLEYGGQPSGVKAGKEWLRRRVAVAFQHPEQQLFAQTALADIMQGPLNLGRTKTQAQDIATTSLRELGLDVARAGRESPFRYSGSEQRRIALAGVLAMQPRLLLLDEPTAGLDAPARELVLQALARASSTGGSCVLATHDIALAASFSSRILVLHHGRLVCDSHPGWLFADYESLGNCGLAPAPLDRLAAVLHGACGWELPARRWEPATLATALAGILRSGAV